MIKSKLENNIRIEEEQQGLRRNISTMLRQITETFDRVWKEDIIKILEQKYIEKLGAIQE